MNGRVSEIVTVTSMAPLREPWIKTVHMFTRRTEV